MDVNEDGTVVVGYFGKQDGPTLANLAFIWTADTMLFIQDLFNKSLLKGYHLDSAVGISLDGTMVIGNASEYRFFEEPSHACWYAYIPRLDILKKEGLDLIKKLELEKNAHTSHKDRLLPISAITSKVWTNITSALAARTTSIKKEKID